MVRRALRSTSYRKLKRVTPGGRAVTHYERRRPGPAHCAACSSELHGVPRLRTAKARQVPHVSRRPERAYGGQLCPSCTAERVKLEKLYLYTPLPEAPAVAEAAVLSTKRSRKVERDAAARQAAPARAAPAEKRVVPVEPPEEAAESTDAGTTALPPSGGKQSVPASKR